ncbi:GNAT family N-acetyltransferase [Oceanobacter mangrovi]|uniref:GNAT family N-acetyltransferase n=1 Tax=Oceanobacter mangrovi TaxID=2862510 RepID=UPI001FE66C70|nr:GNAT family N-acetyltransferase [Oceanobacter mangrovi]
MTANYSIRPMTRSEVDMAVEWAAQEGWNPGLYDADCYFAADLRGFLVGLLNDEPIACISAIRYPAASQHADNTGTGEDFGFIGFYIVKPEYRGQGYGIQIWNAAMNYLHGCNIALDGVVAQQDNYRRSGFTLAWRNMRFEGKVPAGLIPSGQTVSLQSLPFAEVERHNNILFPTPRPAFLQCWIQQAGATALGIMEHGKLAASGVIRPCRSGYKVGPLYAESAAQAQQCLNDLLCQLEPDSTFYLDVPETNPDALALAESLQMQLSFETARMYTASTPDLPWQQLYGVTSFEIG